jgi:hypothetical protein
MQQLCAHLLWYLTILALITTTCGGEMLLLLSGVMLQGGGAVWLNPPYGRAIKEFVAKADAESKKGITVVCLVPARTDTNWWWDSCIHHEVRFIKGRLKFGGQKNSAPFPSAVIVMGKTNPHRKE